MLRPGMHRLRRIAGIAAIAACLGAAVPRTFAAATTQEEPVRKDEAELVRDADDIEKRIASSGTLLGDARLDGYLQSTVEGLLEPGDLPAIRVRVVEAPLPNAFVLPNGAAYVTTAMLDMVDNEAQLACVLGHEMTHYLRKHALEEVRAQRTRQNWGTALAVLVGAAGAYYGGGQVGQALANLTAGAGQLWTLSAVSGYSQDNEREADAEGFRRIAARGYDTAQAARVFELLEQRTPDDATEARPYFASHPKLQERIASMRGLAQASGTPAGGRTDAERYLTAIGELPIDHALFLLDLDEHAAARVGIDHFLARQPGSARAHYVSGEIWRHAHDTPGAAEQALAEYATAANLPGTPPEAWRNAGLMHRERGEGAAAREAFARYLALAPQALDAGLVRLYLAELDAPASPP